jgi:hypothetical protein
LKTGALQRCLSTRRCQASCVGNFLRSIDRRTDGLWRIVVDCDVARLPSFRRLISAVRERGSRARRPGTPACFHVADCYVACCMLLRTSLRPLKPGVGHSTRTADGRLALCSRHDRMANGEYIEHPSIVSLESRPHIRLKGRPPSRRDSDDTDAIAQLRNGTWSPHLARVQHGAVVSAGTNSAWKGLKRSRIYLCDSNYGHYWACRRDQATGQQAQSQMSGASGSRRSLEDSVVSSRRSAAVTGYCESNVLSGTLVPSQLDCHWKRD